MNISIGSLTSHYIFSHLYITYNIMQNCIKIGIIISLTINFIVNIFISVFYNFTNKKLNLVNYIGKKCFCYNLYYRITNLAKKKFHIKSISFIYKLKKNLSLVESVKKAKLAYF